MWWSLGAAVVGSLTAILISVIIYPWQKSIDRSADLLKEKRQLIGKILAILSNTDELFVGDKSTLQNLLELAFQGSMILSSDLNVAIFELHTLATELRDNIYESNETDEKFELRDDWKEDFYKRVGDISYLARQECLSTENLHPTLLQWATNAIRGKNK